MENEKSDQESIVKMGRKRFFEKKQTHQIAGLLLVVAGLSEDW